MSRKRMKKVEKMDGTAGQDRQEAERSPRMEARRAAILEAAAEVFFEMGFERANLGAIVRRSGGSLSTLYQLFGNKEGLFEAMVTERCTDVMKALAEPDVPLRDPCTTLCGIAHAFMGVILRPDAQGLWRIIMSEGIKFPSLPEVYFREGPDKLIAHLSEYLVVLHRAGVADVPNPMDAARSFCMLVHSDLYYRVVTGMQPVPDDAALADHIRGAVAMFWRIIMPAGGGKTCHPDDISPSRG